MRKAEFSKLMITKDLHRKFIKEFPEYKDMTWTEFYEGWLDIAKEIRQEAVHNPLGVRLGSYLGELKLQFLPYKLDTVDHVASVEAGEEVRNANIDTRGKSAKLKWERRFAVKFNKILQFYAFDETRELNRLAFEYMLENSGKLRVARVTLGGMNIWRKRIKK